MGAVLLLNASFEPMKVISWQKAICLFFTKKVEIIEEYEHEIRSVSVAIKAPAVVRSLKYVRGGAQVPPFSRFNILARDGFKCQYCRIELNSKIATLDHVIPRSKGGKTSFENVVCCCKSCNIRKGSRTPEQARMTLIKEPYRPDWLPVLKFRFDGRIHPAWETFLSAFSGSAKSR